MTDFFDSKGVQNLRHRGTSADVERLDTRLAIDEEEEVDDDEGGDR
jgi:hypothetical protein